MQRQGVTMNTTYISFKMYVLPRGKLFVNWIN